MSASSEILKGAEASVTALYGTRLPSWAKYHTLAHTREVVAFCLEIGAGMKLDAADMEVVLLAGWFHDAGYVEGAEEHEERSAAVAEEFLRSRAYPEDRIRDVVGCIRATKIPQRPATLLQKIMCDSDVAYIGGNTFWAHSDALRMEWEMRRGVRFTEEKWLEKNIEFVERCTFHTSYAQDRYGSMRESNLRELVEKLADGT